MKLFFKGKKKIKTFYSIWIKLKSVCSKKYLCRQTAKEDIYLMAEFADV